MKFQSIIQTVVVVVSSVTTMYVLADKNPTFPTDSQFKSYQYPPLAPYVFGQNAAPQQRSYAPSTAQKNNTTRPYIQRQPIQNGSFPNFNQPNNMMPFGNNSNNGFNPFSNGNMPFGNNTSGMMPTNPMTNMFGNSNNMNMPFFNSNNSNRKKAWGDKRNIWPDFYTDFTDEAWDEVTSGPRKLGRMPGGWRFPYISTPDPVTVSDAITNQFPPIAEEAGNMMDFSDWGVFD